MLNRHSHRRNKRVRFSPLIIGLIASSVILTISGLGLWYYSHPSQGFVRLEDVTIPAPRPPINEFIIGPPAPIEPPNLDALGEAAGQQQANQCTVSKNRPLTDYTYRNHIPIIVFTFNRPENLRLTLESLFAAMPSEGFAVYVSQDGDDREVRKVIESYGNRLTRLSFTYKATPRQGYSLSYQKIAGHYGFALGQIFDNLPESKHFDRVIMLEDDMKLSPDFFSYFRAMAPLFDRDPSLYCVSAWNDNGQPGFVADPNQLYRTDCFPGLGWMMPRALWAELGRGNWTWGFWDDWLREPQQRKGRSCIYPEINRVSTFGAVGTSGGQFYDQYLRHIKANTVDICWSDQNVNLLEQITYDGILGRIVNRAEVAVTIDEAKQRIDAQLDKGRAAADVDEQRVAYTSLDHLTQMIAPIGLITDHKAGVPRTSYKQVMQFRYKGVRIWLFHKDAAILSNKEGVWAG